MYRKLKKNNPIKQHSKPEKNDEEKLSQIFMVQHYNKQHNAFVQYIKNESESQICYAKTSVSYINMLQMGDSPELDSIQEALIQDSNRDGKMAALQLVRQEMKDISKFNYLVYDEVAKA